MANEDIPNRDFGDILEDFERRQGDERKPRGKLIRQQPEEKPKTPPRLQLDTGPDEDFGAALAAFEAERPGAVADGRREPSMGDRVRGTILSLDLESALVDVGAKAEAVIPTEYLTDEDGALRYAAGDAVEGEVVSRDPESGAWIVRPSDAPASGGDLHEGQMVEGVVASVNKGGVDVEIGKQRAFCPISQLADRYVEDAATYLGRKLRFRVTKAGGRRGDLVVSRRVLLEEEKQAAADQLRASLEPGAVLRGKVTALERYGAFVDLGGIEGLVHISELSHQRVGHPSELLTLGEEVDVKVLSIERDPKGRDRVSLSRKTLERDPWLDAVGKWAEGTTTRGTVRRLEAFGAFVELEPGVDGLVHISELGKGRRISHPREVLSVGQELAVRVLTLDADKQRIGLQPVDDGELARAEPGVEELIDSYRGKPSGSAGGSGAGLGSMAHFFEKSRKKN